MLSYALTDLVDADSIQIIQDGFERYAGLRAIATDALANPITDGADFSEFINKILVKDADANEPVIEKDIKKILRSGKTITLKNSYGSCSAAAPLMLEGELIGLFICGPDAQSAQSISEAQVAKSAKFLAAITEALSQMAYTGYLTLNNSHAMEQSALSASNTIAETALKMKQAMQSWIEILTEAQESDDLDLIKKQIEQLLVTGTDVYTAVNDSVQNINEKTGGAHLIETEYNIRYLLSHYIDRAREMGREKNLDFDYDIDESVPLYFFGDNERIAQIVYTLFKSSAKRLSSGGARLHISAEKSSYASMLILRFSDLTQGFEDEELEALQMFIETGDQSYLENSRVPGMGYRTLNRIVGQMFGHINFEITSDTEMDFVIKIPQLEVEVEELGS